MFLALLIIPAVFVYLMCSGLAYRVAEMNHRDKCDRCDDEAGGDTSVYHEWPELAWFLMGLAWPVMLPVALGLKLSTAQMPKFDFAARRDAKELSRARFMTDLAILRLEEAKALEEAERRNPLTIRK